MRTAIFPGSFDPFTIGHYSVVKRALTLVDKVVIAIGVNDNKRTLFSLEDRENIIRKAFEDDKRVEICSYDSLTVDFAKQMKCDFILRGIRSIQDFEYERTIADANRAMTGIETLLLFTEPQHSFVSSTVVRDIVRYGKDASQLMPPNIDLSLLQNKILKK